MNQLSKRELDEKIQSFLQARFAEHPEIKDVTPKSASVVSRVKDSLKSFQLRHEVAARTS